jgi:hypothetical protein
MQNPQTRNLRLPGRGHHPGHAGVHGQLQRSSNAGQRKCRLRGAAGGLHTAGTADRHLRSNQGGFSGSSTLLLLQGLGGCGMWVLKEPITQITMLSCVQFKRAAAACFCLGNEPHGVPFLLSADASPAALAAFLRLTACCVSWRHFRGAAAAYASCLGNEHTSCSVLR